MGISAVLQDEHCNQISDIVLDSDEVINAALPDIANGSYSCVRFIDPYGDTIFNPLQARVMIQEWDGLKPLFLERNAEALWTDIRKLIVRCSEEPHVYLKFAGD